MRRKSLGSFLLRRMKTNETTTAVIGPDYRPNEFRAVEVLRRAEGAGRFMRCRDERGRELTIH